MKKYFKSVVCVSMALVFLSQTAYAKMGDMGFFGGISQGTRLPKTTETLIAAAANSNNKVTTTSLLYKEVLFLSGTPATFTGTLTVKYGAIPAGKTIGTYQETYTVAPSAATEADKASIRRTIIFNVNYRVEGTQVIKDYQVARWAEVLSIGGTTYTLDPVQSNFGLSIIEDNTPGVTYYKGNVSQRAVYTTGTGGNNDVIVNETVSSLYGYSSAWSATEAHRVDGTVSTDGWQMQYQIRPSVSVNKELQYSQNEPQAISFAGNYREILQNQSGLQYDIIVKPTQFYDIPDNGGETIASYNSFEQLLAPDVAFLKGHAAQPDIEKLFAMQILDGDTKQYRPEQAITRIQFVTAVAKAVKLPIEQQTTTRGRTTTPTTLVFPDVPPTRAEYPYIMAAYKAGLAVGRTGGYFFADSPIERQEAIVILLRTLGLENLGLDPTPSTIFADDKSIASWAKREMSAAEKIGLITADVDGNIHPKTIVSKAEAAALINRLIEYMRDEIALDYTYIVNYGD